MTPDRSGSACRRGLLTFLGLFALALSSAASHAQASGGAMLRPGDAIRIDVYRHPDFSGEVGIAADSTLLHPIFREVRAAGVSMETLRQRLQAVLTRWEAEPQFVFAPLLRVAVGGHVRAPSLYMLPPLTTVAEALATAGGMTEGAAVRKVELYRGGVLTVLDMSAPTGTLAQSTIQSGDQIMVPRRRSIFRDYVAPMASVTAALLSVANFIFNN